MEIRTLRGLRLEAADRAAIKAYEDYCHEIGHEPTDDGRLEWVRTWRALDEDHRLAGVKAEQRDASHDWLPDEPDHHPA